MTKLSCLVCGRVSDGSRCEVHRLEKRRARAAERRSNVAIVEAWVAAHGWWCPGFERDGHPSTDLTVDHVVPLAAGTGDDRRSVLCRGCNSRKSDR